MGQRTIDRCGATAAGLLIGILAVAALPSTPAGGQDGAGSPSVDGAVQVTSNEASTRGHTAPAMAVNPRNHREIAIADGDVYSGACQVHVSRDGGLSWRQVSRPKVATETPRCVFQTFGPTVDVTFGPDGTLYYAFSGYDPTIFRSQVYLAQSDDLGASWTTTQVPSIERDIDAGEMGMDAMPSVAVDPNDPDSVHVGWGSNSGAWTLDEEVLEGQLYYWDVIQRAYVASSDDGGETFGEPVNVGEGLRLTEEAEGVKPPPQVLVGNSGEVYAVFGEYSRAGDRDNREGEAPPASIYMAVSADGGQSYDNRTIYTQEQPTESSAWTWVPRAAIDRDNGTLYVAWEEMSHAGEPVQIAVIRSTNGGETWSSPSQVNDVVPDRQWNYPEAFPDIAVAPDGRVDVVWYDWRNDPTYDADDDEDDNELQDVYYSYSTNGGRNWAPNVRVTDRMIDRTDGPSSLGGIRGPLAVTALEQGAYIAWDDTRTATEADDNQDVYFARARFAEPSAFFSAAPADESGWVRLALIGASVVGLAGVLFLLLGRVMRSKRLQALSGAHGESAAAGS